jgi:hypothetical protein
MRELDDIEARIPDSEDAELLAVLDTRLRSVSRTMIARRPPEFPPEMLDYTVRQIRARVESIRRDGGEDPKVLDQLKQIDTFIDRLLTTEGEHRVKINRLLLFEDEHIDPLYQAVVISRGQEGLLRGTPR